MSHIWRFTVATIWWLVALVSSKKKWLISFKNQTGQTICPVVLTIEGVQRFAVSDDGQRVVVIKFIIKLVRVRVWLSRLWRTGAVVRCVMLLTGVVGITALRTDGNRQQEWVSCLKDYDTALLLVYLSQCKSFPWRIRGELYWNPSNYSFITHSLLDNLFAFILNYMFACKVIRLFACPADLLSTDEKTFWVTLSINLN